MAYLLAACVVFVAFGLLGIGILFFNRNRLTGQCGRVPTSAECPVKAAGICPTNTENEALTMALTFRRFNQQKNREFL
jgi:hypothetical protein